MEQIYTGMATVLTTYNTFDIWLDGKLWQTRFSLELVGEEGQVHFYIRTHKAFQKMIEAQVYAQYPDAEVLEVEDYSSNFPKIMPNKYWDMWGADFEFVAKDPIPIKTYDKFEESVTGEMIDPMAAIIETLGQLGPGQHVWLQYVLQPIPEGENKKIAEAVIKKLKGEPEVVKMGPLGHLWDVIKNIPKGLLGAVEFKGAEKKDQGPLEFRLSPIEKDILKATEENIGKNLFKTKMRYIYLARRESFDGGLRSAFIGAIKQFNDINFNQVKPEDISKTYGKIFFKKPRADFRKRKLYARYKTRNMDGVNVVFSTKELATLFHFPDMSVKSPAAPRTAAKLGSAPSNLPVG